MYSQFDIAVVEPYTFTYCHLLVPYLLSIPFINLYSVVKIVLGNLET